VFLSVGNESKEHNYQTHNFAFLTLSQKGLVYIVKKKKEGDIKKKSHL